MSAPNPEDFSLLQKVLAAGAVVGVPLWGAWTWLAGRFDRKLDKQDFSEFCKRFDQHCRDDRETQAKLFDKIDDLKTTVLERLPR